MDADLLLLCAFRLWRSRQAGRRYRVVGVTDDPVRYPERACRAQLAPWGNWVTVVEWRPLDEGRAPGSWTGRADVCLAAVKRPEHLERLRTSPGVAGVIEPVVPPKGSLDDDLYSEVCHFDFEFGGRNEWDGVPSAHPGPTLQRLSAALCRELYPAFALEDMPRGAPWRVLDVGCGPVSVLRWGALSGAMTITGLDPLLEMYAVVRARHGYDALPEIRCAHELPAFAEDLDTLVPDGAFDVIHTQNALDHTREPQRVIGHFAQKLAPGGRVIVQVATREGTRQKWDQLHKTDIDLREGELVFRHQHGPERALLAPEFGLRLRNVHYYGPDWLSVILERADAGVGRAAA